MEIFAGFVFGFAGSLHCIGMCGPIVLALPGGAESLFRFAVSRLAYHIGRVLTYTMMGVVAGVFGGRVLLPVLQQNLSILGGLVLVLGVLMSRYRHQLLESVPGLGNVTRGLQRIIGDLMRERSLPSLFALGMANGLLPCGFVYVAMTAAAVTAHPLPGLLFMMGFGVGTVPAMVGFSFFPRLASAKVRASVGRILPAFTLLVGILLIVRGLNLGIPFISPKLVPGSTPQMMRGHD